MNSPPGVNTSTPLLNSELLIKTRFTAFAAATVGNGRNLDSTGLSLKSRSNPKLRIDAEVTDPMKACSRVLLEYSEEAFRLK